MLKSRFIIFIVSLGFGLSIWNCSKEVKPELPSEKITITTTSEAALEAYRMGGNSADVFQLVDAANHYKKAIELDPDFAMAWLQLAYASPGITLFLEALDSAKANAEAVSDAERLIIQAADYAVLQNNMRHRAALNQLVNEYPGDEMAHLLLGNYYFGVQQYNLAVKSYTNAIVLNEKIVTPYNQLGYSQRALGNYGEAEKAFKSYVRLNPKNANAYDSYAELLMEMGRHKESIEFYNQALAIDPRFASSHIGIACNYSILGEPEKARAQLLLLKTGAENTLVTRRAIFSEALSYIYEGDVEQALATVQINRNQAKLENDTPNEANDLIVIGNLYLELGKPEQALNSFSQSIKMINGSGFQQEIIQNAQTTHLFNVSQVFALQGEFKRAEQMAKTFYEQVFEGRNPIQIRLAFQLNGIIALAQKDYQLAIENLEQSNQLNPMNLYRLGQAYTGAGREQDAANMIQRASELNVLNNMNQALVLSKTKFKKTS